MCVLFELATSDKIKVLQISKASSIQSPFSPDTLMIKEMVGLTTAASLHGNQNGNCMDYIMANMRETFG